MTDADLRKIREASDRATPGPWFGPRVTPAWPPGEWGVYEADEETGEVIPHALIARMEDVGDDTARDNAAFVAVARGAVPALLDEVAALRIALTEALDIFDSAWCPEFGHAPRAEQLIRITELRKLVQP